MDTLLEKDHYKDYSEVVAMAVENLWILDREVREKGPITISKDSASPFVSQSASPIEGAKRFYAGKVAFSSPFQNQAAATAPASVATVPVRIPELFQSDGLDRLTSAVAEDSTIGSKEGTYTLDRWIFGQFNRLLPAKVNCRALLRLTAGQENGSPLDFAATQIADAAVLLGDYLADHDRRHGIGRDDALATAFPHSGSDAEKGRARYVNQFVGSVNRQNVLSGLLRDYRLAGLTSGNEPRLLPTQQAIHLARLANPILDACQLDPADRFSPEEKAFLLEHIRSFVSVEAFAFRTLIQAIADGADTPDKLDEALRPLVPTDSNRSLSPSFLTSQRSGALSRMADLGLIARVRRGVKVSYIITPSSKTFLLDRRNEAEKGNG